MRPYVLMIAERATTPPKISLNITLDYRVAILQICDTLNAVRRSC